MSDTLHNLLIQLAEKADPKTRAKIVHTLQSLEVPGTEELLLDQQQMRSGDVQVGGDNVGNDKTVVEDVQESIIAINSTINQSGLTDADRELLQGVRDLLKKNRTLKDTSSISIVELEARLEAETLKEQTLHKKRAQEWNTLKPALWIGGYLFVWFIILAFATFFIMWIEHSVEADLYVWWTGLLIPAVLAAMGSVIGAFYVLVKHVELKRDFDPVFSFWYLTMPLLGGMLGVGMYYVVTVLGALGSAVSGNAMAIAFNSPSPLLYPLYFLIGFRPDEIWGLLNRGLQKLSPATAPSES